MPGAAEVTAKLVEDGGLAMTEKTRSSHGAPVVDRYPHCWKCGKLLAEFLTRPWQIRCRCKARNPRPTSSVAGASRRPNAHQIG